MSEEKNDAYDIVKNMMKHKKEETEVSEEVNEPVEGEAISPEMEAEFKEAAKTAEEDTDFALFDDASIDGELKLSDDEARDALSDDLKVTLSGKNTKVNYVNPETFGNIIKPDKVGDVQKELLKALNRKAFGNSSYAEVVAVQSGYSCKVKPLTNSDSFRIFNSKGTLFDNEDMTFRTIYDKIAEFSCGTMSYGEWLKKTSLGDLESFYYGLYCATFIDEGTFKFKCTNSKCNKISEAVIRNKSLIRVANYEEMKKLEETIAKESKSEADRIRLSLVDDVNHIILSESGIGVEIKNPTLADILVFYKTTNSDIYNAFSAVDIHSMLHVSGILVPAEIKGSWYPITDRATIINLFDKLSINDAAELRTAIGEQLEKRRVSFAISEVKCQHCGKTIKNVPLNLRDILFTLISEKRQ